MTDTSVVAAVNETQVQNDAAYFPPQAKVLFYFRDYPTPISVDVLADHEIIIGRTTPNTPMAPDVDLTVVKGGHYGVSRMHAALKRQDTTLLISDLGSLNRTFLNGDPLHPNEVRVLRHGDVVSFAKLATRIQFG